MAWTSDELKQWLLDYVSTNPGWNWSQWNDETYILGLHHKFDFQLEALQVMYTQKLRRIYKAYKEIFEYIKYGVSDIFLQATSEDDILDLKPVKDKVKRIARKLRGVNAEIEGRSRGFFGPGLTYDRKYIGTTYYIDLDAGNDGNNGLAIGTPWLTLAQYTTTTVRTPGDRALIRANTTEAIGATVQFDEDGDEDDLIYIIGCNSQSPFDPWGDADDTMPIFNGGGAGRYMNVQDDSYWAFQNFTMRFSGSGNGNLYLYNAFGHRFNNCWFNDNPATYGIRARNSRDAIFTDCHFNQNSSSGIADVTAGCQLAFRSCEMRNNGSDGVSIALDGTWELIDCILTANGGDDVAVDSQAEVFLRNTKYGSLAISDAYGVVYSEDDNGVLGANKIYYNSNLGTIEKDDSIVRLSGQEASQKWIPGANCGLNYALNETQFRQSHSKKIWLASGGWTVTVYIRATTAWAVYPIANELYVLASYLSGSAGSGGERVEVMSTAVLSDGASWVQFDVSVAPTQEGFVYIDIFLKTFEAGESIQVDPNYEVIGI